MCAIRYYEDEKSDSSYMYSNEILSDFQASRESLQSLISLLGSNVKLGFEGTHFFPVKVLLVDALLFLEIYYLRVIFPKLTF